MSNRGYAGVTRVVRDGGAARMEGNTLVIENASSVMLLTRIDYFPDYSEEQVEATRQALEKITPDYAALLERARKVQSEMLNRVTVDFGGASKYGLSSEELLSDQRSSPGYSGAFLEAIFDMCRYWFILTSGKYCSMSAETNANINLQLAPMALGYHREGEEAYFNWMESLVPDFRTNAKNIFGMRGTKYSLTPSKEWGVETMFDHAGSTETGETWPHPYWLGDGPLVCAPVLGPLPGHRRFGFPPQARGAGLQRPGAVLRGFPDRYGQGWELHFRSILLAGEQSGQPEPFVHVGDQRQHGHRGVPGSPGQFGGVLRAARHRGRQRAEMEGDAGQAAALPARTGRRPEGMGLAHAGESVMFIGTFLISTAPGPATKLIPTARRNWPRPR